MESAQRKGAVSPARDRAPDLRRAVESSGTGLTPRGPKLPRCGVCDATGTVLHCQNCDEPTCAAHIQRVYGCEGVPASYLCTLCVEELRPPVATPLPIDYAGVATWA